eukprot:gene8569-17679_t
MNNCLKIILISKLCSLTSSFGSKLIKQSKYSYSSTRLLSTSWKSRHIASDINEKVKHLVAVQQRKKKNLKDFVVLEGHRIILDAVAAAADAPLGPRLLESLHPLYEHCVHSTTDSIIHKITETVTSQGCIGLFRIPVRTLPSVCTLLVVCDGVSDPGNLGTVVRTGYGFGADGSSKVIRSSMGMILRYPVITASGWPEVADIITSRNLQVLLADVNPTARPLYDADLRKPTAIVIGSEGFGISDEAKSLSGTLSGVSGSLSGSSSGSGSIYIPMCRPLESLNAGVAASIILGETARQRSL